MNALQSLARRIRAPKHGTNKAAAAELAALAALPPDHPVNMPLPAPVLTAEIRGLANAVYPQAPTLTPGARDLANTRPFHAPAGRHVAPGTAPARPVPRHVQQDDGTLLRVRDRLRDLPAAPLSRQEQFAADMQPPRKGGLPVFQHVARKIGWYILNEELPSVVLARHSAEQWERERESYAALALALGYPGEAL